MINKSQTGQKGKPMNSFRCALALVLLLIAADVSAQQKRTFTFDVQFLKLGVKADTDSGNGIGDAFVKNEDLTAGAFTGNSKFRSLGVNIRSQLTPRFAFDYGTANRGWTVLAWGFRQTENLGSVVSSPNKWKTDARNQAASIDAVYRMRMAEGISVYAGIKAAYASRSIETRRYLGMEVIDSSESDSTSACLGPVVGVSYSVKYKELRLSASLSQSVIVARLLRTGIPTVTKIGGITEGMVQLSLPVSRHARIGVGAFCSNWQNVAPSKTSFGGTLASLDLSF